MFSCLKPFFSVPVITTDFIAHPNEEGNLVGVLFKRLSYGKWSARLGELTRQNQLNLYKAATDFKVYDLRNMKKLVIGGGQKRLHVKMTLINGEKLRLKIKGPDRMDWGARISGCKFDDEEEEEEEVLPISKSRFWTTGPYETGSSYDTSLEKLSVTPSEASMQSTLQREEEKLEEEAEEAVVEDPNESHVSRMAKVFEPGFQQKKGGTLPRRYFH